MSIKGVAGFLALVAAVVVAVVLIWHYASPSHNLPQPSGPGQGPGQGQGKQAAPGGTGKSGLVKVNWKSREDKESKTQEKQEKAFSPLFDGGSDKQGQKQESPERPDGKKEGTTGGEF